MEDARRKKYYDLLLRLSGHVVKGNADHKKLMTIAREKCLTTVEQQSDDFLEICNVFERRGLLDQDTLGILKEIFPREANKMAYMDIVNTEKDMYGDNQDSNDGNRQPGISVSEQFGRGQHLRKRVNTNPSSPVDTKVARVGKETKNKEYEKTDGQKGFMVFLIWTHKADEADKDVGNILKFFKDKLGWYTEDNWNLTEAKLKNYISDLQSRFMASVYAEQFYCFGVTVIGHGRKGEIEIEAGKKKFYRIQTLIDHFKNDSIPNLVGKPKFFLIEACRGKGKNTLVERTRNPVQERDVADYIELPADSDIHIAYATTEGNVSFLNTKEGSWFISAAMEAFASNYKDCHMEEMLTTVRYNVANQRSLDYPNAGQMPCSWTTFTKNLYFLECKED